MSARVEYRPGPLRTRRNQAAALRGAPAQAPVVTQTLSAEKERLKVVVEVSSAETGPHVLTYERK